ncbi:MAG: hypothetical protein VXZ73_01440 [Pseudomonadota bacterium]|nr:hypothetical protein [Pseudomonadota bacterium]
MLRTARLALFLPILGIRFFACLRRFLLGRECVPLHPCADNSRSVPLPAPPVAKKISVGSHPILKIDEPRSVSSKPGGEESSNCRYANPLSPSANDTRFFSDKARSGPVCPQPLRVNESGSCSGETTPPVSSVRASWCHGSPSARILRGVGGEMDNVPPGTLNLEKIEKSNLQMFGRANWTIL